MICMDCEFPEPARLLALAGAQLLLVPTALTVGPVDRLTPESVIPTRALENHTPLLYCNCNGQASVLPAVGCQYSCSAPVHTTPPPPFYGLCRP